MEKQFYIALNLNSVGERIIEARKAKDYTQLDLSKRLGISRAAVGQWEIDSTSPSISKLEEVAIVLDVAPEWLAYNVIPGETRVVYRSPGRENIVWIDEMRFGHTSDDLQSTNKWGIPDDFLRRDIRASVEDTIICTINSHAVAPEFEFGDKVLVDRLDKKPSPGGTFLYWDGIGFAYARMHAVPGPTPKVRISQKGADTTDMAFEDILIVGRVKGRFQID